MAADSTGTRGEPQFIGGGAPDLAVDSNLLAAYARKVGNRRTGTTAERTAATGVDVWEGLLWGDTTTGLEYRYTSSGWRVLAGAHAEVLWTRSAIADGAITLFSCSVDSARTNEAVASVPGTASQTITLRDKGVYAVSWHFGIGNTATALGNADVTTTADGLIARTYIPAGTNSGTLNQSSFAAQADGVVLTFTLTKYTGGNSDVTGRVRVTKIGAF